MGRGLGMMAADKYIYINFLLSTDGQVRKHSRAKLVLTWDMLMPGNKHVMNIIELALLLNMGI